MNQQLRAQSKARILIIEARLRAIERLLDAGRNRSAMDEICEMRAQLEGLFVALLVDHIQQRLPSEPFPLEPSDRTQWQDFDGLFRQLLNLDEPEIESLAETDKTSEILGF